MDLYNRKVTEYWLRRIMNPYPEHIDTVSRLIDALRLAGTGDAKIVSHVQLAYEIIKVNDSDIRG
jgi:hypothetical protein